MIVLLYFITANAQEIVPLYESEIPGAKPTPSTYAEHTEVRSNGTLSITKVSVPTMTVFVAPKEIVTGTAVIICPGGGYGVLAYDWEGSDIAKWLNANGITAIVLKYRLPNSKSNIVPHQSPLMDAQRAIRTVRANAAQWNISKDKVGIMGFSAGGHLASTAGTHFDNGNATAADSIERYSSRPDFMILMYPVITMSKPFMHQGSRNNLIGANGSKELAAFYSNEIQVTKETPPTLLIHATDDEGVPVENSLYFYQALKDHNVPAEMHIYPYGGHGFGLAIGQGHLQTWTDRCIDWLKSLKK